MEKEIKKALVVDKNDKYFGKTVNVYKIEDDRFFANRWGDADPESDRCWFKDQLAFNSGNDPIPVMFSVDGDIRGPWQLGFIHPDDYKTVVDKDGMVNYFETDVNVFGMFDGIPYIPKLITPLKDFKAPAWRPSWNWNTYCENRKNN